MISISNASLSLIRHVASAFFCADNFYSADIIRHESLSVFRVLNVGSGRDNKKGGRVTVYSCADEIRQEWGYWYHRIIGCRTVRVTYLTRRSGNNQEVKHGT